MAQYTLTLTRTTWGTPGPPPNHNQTPVEKRHARALKVAKRFVTVLDVTRTPNHQSIWKVEGEDIDVCDLLAIWERHKNMTYVVNPPLKCGDKS